MEWLITMVMLFICSPPSECQREAFSCLQRRIHLADPGRVTSSIHAQRGHVPFVMFFLLLVETVTSSWSFSAVTVLCGADYVMGSSLPSHSDVQLSCFTGNRIQVRVCVCVCVGFICAVGNKSSCAMIFFTEYRIKK